MLTVMEINDHFGFALAFLFLVGLPFWLMEFTSEFIEVFGVIGAWALVIIGAGAEAFLTICGIIIAFDHNWICRPLLLLYLVNLPRRRPRTSHHLLSLSLYHIS